MRAHVIEDGKVVNTIEVESLDFMPNLIDATRGGVIGDLWDGARFTAPDPVIVIPQSVTMRQARLALLAIGKLSAVQPAIDSMPSPQKEQATIEWEFAGTVDRTSALVAALGPLIGLSSVELDNLFIEADKL